MTPYEIMLSESQERMLLVAERGREREVFGRVQEVGTRRGRGRRSDRRRQCCACWITARVAAEIPAHPLAEEGPVYQRPIAQPAPRDRDGGGLVSICGCDGAESHGKFQRSCWRRRRLRRSDGSPSSTTRWCARIRWFGPGASDAAVLRLKDPNAKRTGAGAVDRRQWPLVPV